MPFLLINALLHVMYLLIFRRVHCITAAKTRWSIAAFSCRHCILASSVSEIFIQTSLASNTGVWCAFVCIADVKAVKLQLISYRFITASHIFLLLSTADQFVNCNCIAGKIVWCFSYLSCQTLTVPPYLISSCSNLIATNSARWRSHHSVPHCSFDPIRQHQYIIVET